MKEDRKYDEGDLHQTDIACSWLVCHSRGTVQLVSTNPASAEARPPSFFGNQPCVPVAWLAERLLLESNPGPKPTLKALSHTRTQPPTLTKYTSSSVQPPQTCPTPLLSTSPHTHSIHSRPNTTYTSRLLVVVYPLPWPLLVGGVRCSRLWSTSQLLRPSGQQCSHSGGVCPQIQGRQCGAYVGAVEEMMCVVCVDVTEGA